MTRQPLKVSLATVVLATAAVLAPDPSGAQDSSRYGTWQSPDQSRNREREGGAQRLQELIDKLARLVDDADRAKAADRRFIADLRDLIRAYDWPWQVGILSEDFTDGSVAPAPTWTVSEGQFKAVRGVGLHSVVQTSPRPSGSGDSGQDLATALLNQILEQAARKNQPAAAESARQTRATIYAPVAITNAFALTLEVSTRSPEGRIEFGLYQKSPAGVGYRLAYQPARVPSVELLRTGSRGVSVIDAYHQTLPAEAGSPRTLRWTRARNGEMVVSIDGAGVIRSVDRGLQDSFDGLLITNLDGDFALRTLELAGAR